MKTKKCNVPPLPEPPPPDPCKLQRRRQKEKAGIKICPEIPIVPPPPPPTCHALCIEKIKNPPITITNHPVVCVVEREPTGTARCDEIERRAAAQPTPPWPGCLPPPPLPPLPAPDLCEERQKKKRVEECKERMKRYRL
ncbi:wiskott-Aldrich syndrome protein family member 1-like [Vanessa atalanta]|uniref:wiskott-Aldrich syndrome protein family member 1-like n=1 Tax=Vanessa atalanta TaxID=42275 RepID=UPI001FCDF147|nr:wiskott-Aldrich syndrome protein family member 1-like [Vanessa atalanta]